LLEPPALIKYFLTRFPKKDFILNNASGNGFLCNDGASLEVYRCKGNNNVVWRTQYSSFVHLSACYSAAIAFIYMNTAVAGNVYNCYTTGGSRGVLAQNFSFVTVRGCTFNSKTTAGVVSTNSSVANFDNSAGLNSTITNSIIGVNTTYQSQSTNITSLTYSGNTNNITTDAATFATNS